MKQLKVAFCNRPNWDNPLGGDGVQMIKTKEALERNYPITIDIITDSTQLSDKYDIVHIFNYITTDVTSDFFEEASKLKRPIVSSPIFWDYSYISRPLNKLFVKSYYSAFSAALVRITSKIAGFIFGKPRVFSKSFKKYLKDFINESSLILPNSIEEARLLLDYLSIPQEISKVRVVYNATDNEPDGEVQFNISEFLAKYNLPNNFILQVGRLEFLKNQLNLLYALRDVPEIPIVFLGRAIDDNYVSKLKKIARKRGNVYFVDAVPHNEVKFFYRAAKLHVLLSLRESPGLVSLEALSNGCPIVISTKEFTPAETYFQSQKYKVNPFDIKKIKKTVLLAYKECDFNDEDVARFKWDIAAKQTFDAYMELME